MRKRLDRFINDSLNEFAEWYVTTEWHGKERDCVNLFAHRHLAGSPESPVKDLGQIRIECSVPQPKGYRTAAATKDLVIWDGPIDTTWDADWKPVKLPRAVMEWKTKRSGKALTHFDAHDEKWLKAFTEENPKAIGFLVSTYSTKNQRSCMWAVVRAGKVGKVHIKASL